jgi:hypothetical protein
MPAATREEVEALNLLRSMQHRPPLAPHELEGLTYEVVEPRAGSAALPPPSGEEAALLAYVRQLQPRDGVEDHPAASGLRLPDVGRIAGGVLDRVRGTLGANTQGEVGDMSEDVALAYLRDAAGPAPARAQDPALRAAPPTSSAASGPAAPAPGAPEVDPTVLAAAGYPGAVTAAEAELLARIGQERRDDGDPALTTQEATALIARRRWRADAAPARACPA